MGSGGDAGRRLAQRSHCGCGAGLPAQSSVTAGEEAAPRLGAGEVTLRALFSEEVTMPGCPKPANTRGGEKLAWVLPSCTARHHPGFAAFSVLGPSEHGSAWKGCGEEGSDEQCPQSAPHPWLPRGQGFASRQMFCHPTVSPWVTTPSPCTDTSVHSSLCPGWGFPSTGEAEQVLAPSPPDTRQILNYGCLSVDYGSEVSSRVAKGLLLWEPLTLKSLTSVCKIRARFARPCRLLPAELVCCRLLGRAAASPLSRGIYGPAASFPSTLLPSLRKFLAVRKE